MIDLRKFLAKFSLRKKLDLHIAVACALFGAWLIFVLAAPFLVAPGTLTNLSGSVFIIDNSQKLAGTNPVAQLVYTIGDFNCHQLVDRSFFLNGNEMPFCARDTGMFVGLVVERCSLCS